MRLTDLYPRNHLRYSSLPVLGPCLEGFATWLSQQGYPRHRVRVHVRKSRLVDEILRTRGCHFLAAVTRDDLHACRSARSPKDVELVAATRTLERYFDTRGLFPAPDPPNRSEALVHAYEVYLHEVRGLASSTIGDHVATASQLLNHLAYETDPGRLAGLKAIDLEIFVRDTGERLCRESTQHEIAHIRGFLRFLAAESLAPPGLDTQLDTPRLYRLERLPRSLPWNTVKAFLRAIDRGTALGRRDYAIFLLIATYGLRASEVVDLRLDDIEWRTSRLHVPRRKVATPLLLPLVDAVGDALVDYLRRGRPSLPYRAVFLRARAPTGTLKPTAVTEAFQAWSRRSGLDIPYQGAHCLRHSYAIHLLRLGTPLKTIGDLLGHRSAESTCVYLRMAIDDLREVALPLPRKLSPGRDEEACP